MHLCVNTLGSEAEQNAVVLGVVLKDLNTFHFKLNLLSRESDVIEADKKKYLEGPLESKNQQDNYLPPLLTASPPLW